MKNKIIASVMAVTMVFALTACGETSENTPAQTTTKAAETTLIAENTEETEAPAETEAPTETKVPSDDSEDYFDWWGINMYRPADYSVKSSEGFPQAFLSADGETANNIVYLTLKKDDVTTAEDALEYFYHYSINKDILAAEDKVAALKDNELETEEKVQVNGCDFIRQSGVYHCDTVSGNVDFAYTGYFGVMDYPKLGKQPAVFIAFSHHTDDEMKKELARLVDTAAENAAPINK
ncbi:MAG: hypothetical protein J6I46_02200 [Ruminococcus sp.]|nr:hypothetical protein [Ruminococcus sp.]